jgi:hypothetical protein
MKSEKLTLEKKAALIKEKLRGKTSFTVADVRAILDEKDTTLNWTIWNLTQSGYFNRIGKGAYTFEKKEKNVRPILSGLAQKVLSVLQESGQDFFISGLDILSIFMEHVPESYPVLLFVDKSALENTQDILSKNQIDIISNTSFREYRPIRQMASVNEITLMIPTREFSYSEKGLASFEKAFIDLYYEVTRRDYPLPVQELARIYLNMERRLPLNTNRLIKIASRRNIHQDIRYIVERDQISEKAFTFVDRLRNWSR